MCSKMHIQMLSHSIQETMHVLLPKMLCKEPVCPLAPMATSELALATTIGRPREEAPNALD
ncbi:hypothetical protein Patl1_26056 [Pistacia atlantica]|uniref:Uncharacterized protein n=1 Tax=Pistacia atlantica TaxID=434234 RepID=A0ACC1B4D5_9ROSI|nr:hypothetical protein Patl1_26056 [Pistacia atlantica]